MELGFTPCLSICLQIQEPVVKANMEKLAHELEGRAQAQVRRKQRPQWACRSQGEGWQWEKCTGRGRR